MQIPSAGARNRYRFIVDCGYMLTRREYFKSALDDWDAGPAPIALFMYTDSSPQGNTNWQITSYDCVRGEDLATIDESLQFLVHKNK